LRRRQDGDRSAARWLQRQRLIYPLHLLMDRLRAALYNYWASRFGGDPAVLGRTVTIEGESHTVVGVLQKTDGPLESNIAMFTAARWPPPTRKGPFFTMVLARLRPGISAEAALQPLHATNARLFPIWKSSCPRAAGVILLAAGVYQLTPFKRACLTHCRSPLGFLMTHWRGGTRGALLMGLRHGAYCLGCCWALMGVLFAVGVMNLVWVAALSLFVLMEKSGPAGIVIARFAGAAMIAFGGLLASGYQWP
jgi:hypothetical protein